MSSHGRQTAQSVSIRLHATESLSLPLERPQIVGEYYTPYSRTMPYRRSCAIA